MQRLVTFITDKLFRIVNLENYFHTIFNIKLNNNLLWHKNSVGGMQTELQKTKYPRSYESLKNICMWHSIHIILLWIAQGFFWEKKNAVLHFTITNICRRCCIRCCIRWSSHIWKQKNNVICVTFYMLWQFFQQKVPLYLSLFFNQ